MTLYNEKERDDERPEALTLRAEKVTLPSRTAHAEGPTTLILHHESSGTRQVKPKPIRAKGAVGGLVRALDRAGRVGAGSGSGKESQVYR